MPLKWSWKRLPVDENGKSYDSLEAFQSASIAKLLMNEHGAGISADSIVEHKSEIVEILVLNESARPSARGVPKKRKSKTAQPEVKAA